MASSRSSWLKEADTVFASLGETVWDYADEEEVDMLIEEEADPVVWALEVTD